MSFFPPPRFRSNISPIRSVMLNKQVKILAVTVSQYATGRRDGENSHASEPADAAVFCRQCQLLIRTVREC